VNKNNNINITNINVDDNKKISLKKNDVDFDEIPWL
jgi:hypothetical protein